jgi:hypothetical protein
MLQVGNGSGLQIHNIGMICFSKENLLLKDVLHVPHITKNLISANKLTIDNNLCI